MVPNVSQDNLALLFALLLDSIRRDDVNAVMNCQSLHPELFQVNTTAAGTQNPLLFACEHGSCGAAVLIVKHNPGLARAKDQFCRTPLHLASEKGLLSVVNVLVEVDPKLCLIKDRFGLIPLQTAVHSRHPFREEVIRALITACPKSVGRHTSRGETIFHLAVKSNLSTDGFAALLEEAKKLNMLKLLHEKDQCGDTVLHIATSAKQVGVTKLLIPPSSTTGPMVRVNTLNKRRQTALDICCENSRDLANGEIFHILYNAGAVSGLASPSKSRARRDLETTNVILVVLGIVVGASFMVPINLPSSVFHDHKAEAAGNRTFEAREVVSGSLPFVFYLMVFNTSVMAVGMCSMVVLFWSLPFRSVVLFVSVTMGIVYGLIASEVVPEFRVRIDYHDKLFSSSFLVWLLAIAFIFSGAVAQVIFWSLFPFAERLITGKLRTNGHAPIFNHNV